MSHRSFPWGCSWLLPGLAEGQAGPAPRGQPWAGGMMVWDGGSGSSRLRDIFLGSFCATITPGGCSEGFWSAFALGGSLPCGLGVVWLSEFIS